MTTATLAAGNRTMTEVRPRRSLEELVDRLMAALFREEPEKATTETPSLSQSVHEARRLRQAGDPVSSTGQAIDTALAVFAGMDMAKATTREARWAYTEWTDLVRRRFGRSDVVVYSQGTGRAAALVPRGDGTLEVAAVLGMGGPARSSPGAACGGCGPWGGLALDRLGERRGVAAALALSAVPAL